MLLSGTKEPIAFATSSCREINRHGFEASLSRAYNLRHVKIIGFANKLSGAPDSAHSREDTKILLVQIILGSDYSGSVKELYGDYFSQFGIKSFEKYVVRRRERKTNSPFSHYQRVGRLSM